MRMYIHINVRMYICIGHSSAYTHTHTHTHTYICIYYLDPRSHRNAGLQPLLHAHVIREEYAPERLSL